jgi:hypothetical protein
MEVMNQRAGVRAETRLSKGLAFVPKEYPDRRGDWAWLDAKQHRRREVMIIDVVVYDRHACIVECELRPNETCATGILLSGDGELISDDDLHQVLRSHSKVRGVWKNTQGSSRLIVKSLKHAQATHEARAEALLHRIDFEWGR